MFIGIIADDYNDTNENFENIEIEVCKTKQSKIKIPVKVNAEMIEAVAAIFARKQDKRSVQNLLRMLGNFYDGKELSPMQVIKRLSISSSTVYDMIEHLRPSYLEKVAEKHSERGPFLTYPVYKLTANGILLIGFLLKQKHLVMEALQSAEGNPLYKLATVVYEKAPDEMIFDVAYRMLRMKNTSVEVFFDALVLEYSSRLTAEETEKIRMDLELAYRAFAPFEKEITFEYMREKLKHDYFLKLKGKDLQNYHAETQKHPNRIVYICSKCRKAFLTTSNPFENRTICSKCSTDMRSHN